MEIEQIKDLLSEMAKQQQKRDEDQQKQRDEDRKQRDEERKKRDEEQKQRDEERKKRDEERKKRDEDRKQRDEERKELEKKNYEINKRLDAFTGSLGDAAEFEFVQGIVNNNKVCAGISFDVVYDTVRAKREYDIVLLNDEYVALIEVKWSATKQDINTLLYKQVPAFKEEMKSYKDKKLIVFMASYVYNKKIADYALKKGICFLYEKGQKLADQYIEPLTIF